MAAIALYDEGGLFFQARGRDLKALVHDAWYLIRNDHPLLAWEPETVDELSVAAANAGVIVRVHDERSRISAILRRCLSARVAH